MTRARRTAEQKRLYFHSGFDTVAAEEEMVLKKGHSDEFTTHCRNRAGGSPGGIWMQHCFATGAISGDRHQDRRGDEQFGDCLDASDKVPQTCGVGGTDAEGFLS